VRASKKRSFVSVFFDSGVFQLNYRNCSSLERKLPEKKGWSFEKANDYHKILWRKTFPRRHEIAPVCPLVLLEHMCYNIPVV
jgi:hypothetical protein